MKRSTALGGIFEHGTKGQKWGVRKQRQEAAKASHIPVTAEKYQKSKKWEQKVAQAIGGQSFADNQPFDIFAKKVAIELKVLDQGKNDKITMHPDSLARKVREGKKLGLDTATVAVDTRGGKTQIYFKEGLGSFRLGSMEPMRSLDDLRKRLK